MTRKEKIIQKAQELAKKANPIAEHLPMSAIIAACVDMAEWTLNNLWHNASEEQPDSKRLSLGIFKDRTQPVVGYNSFYDENAMWCYLDDILPDREVFVIERLVADGYWELMSDKAYTDEQQAFEDCCCFIKEMQKKDKYANARVKKLII